MSLADTICMKIDNGEIDIRNDNVGIKVVSNKSGFV